MTDKCNFCADDACEAQETLVDFITGKKVPDTDGERIRQQTERFLVETKNYSKEEIEVGVKF